MTEAQVLRRLRRAAGKGQQVADFASRAGVSVSLVYTVLRGESPPRGPILDALGLEIVGMVYRDKVNKEARS